MKRAFFVINIIFFLFSIAYCNDTDTYTHPYFNFTVVHPSNWVVKEISGIVAFISPLASENDDFSENVNVVVENFGNKIVTIEEYKKASVMNMSQTFPSFELIDEGKAIIDDKEGVYVTYTAVMNEAKLKFRVYTFIADSRVYNLTYTAKEETFDRYLSTAEEIIHSIKIEK